MSRTRIFDIAAVALIIAVLAGIGFVLRPQRTPTITVAASAASVDRSQPAAETGPSALFVGDSYTVGHGTKELSYACMAAVRMGWVCNLSAVGSTGYLAGGPTNRFKVDDNTGQSTSFSERVPQLALMYRPDIVFLDGGRNDFQLPPDEVYDAIVWTIAGIRHAWPAATIVFIRPRFISRPEDNLGFDDDFIARLQAEPAAHDIVVIDPLNRLAGSDTSTLLADDQFHPSQHGEEVMSSVLVDSLVDQGFALQR